MLRTLLSAAVVLLLLTSRAQAATINLLLTTNYNEPLYGNPPQIGLDYGFFESPTNRWPYQAFPQPPELAGGGGSMLPGVTQFNVSVEAESLANLYFTAWGEYYTLGTPFPSRYVAEPPTGRVDDGLVHGYGPVWIPLANLGAGFSGEFYYFYGHSRGPIGTWSLAPALAPGPDPMTPVPEPASMLLLGSGLAAIAAKKYRQRKTDVQTPEL